MNAVRQWSLLLAAVVGLAGSMVVAEVVLSHHNWRLDLTPERRFTLSEHSRKLLGGLTQDVQVIAFERSDDARNAEIDDLLNRARNVSPHLHYSVVDVNRSPAVAREYGVGNYGSLVVESGGRRASFTNPREDLLMEAILQVTRPRRKLVYFLTGHGEQNLDDTDHHHGYASARTALRDEFYDVRTLSLLGTADVPADADVLAVAGAHTDPLPQEVAKLAAYVGRGGHLLVLLEPQSTPALAVWLERYGVQAPDDVVVDPQNRLFAGDYLTMIVPGLSASHPVSAALKSPPLFSQARSVHFAGTAAAAVKGIEFLHTAPSSWSTTDFDVLRSGVATFAAGRDHAGPVPVGVSVLVGPPGSVTEPELEAPRVARFIVLGDSDFANNFFIEYLGNKDLLVNAVNWLAGEQGLVGERPPLRRPGVNQFFVSARQGRLAFTLGTIVEPALFLVAGAVIFLRRRWGG